MSKCLKRRSLDFLFLFLENISPPRRLQFEKEVNCQNQEMSSSPSDESWPGWNLDQLITIPLGSCRLKVNWVLQTHLYFPQRRKGCCCLYLFCADDTWLYQVVAWSSYGFSKKLSWSFRGIHHPAFNRPLGLQQTFKLSYKGWWSFWTSGFFSGDLSGSSIPTEKVVSVQIELICGSRTVEEATVRAGHPSVPSENLLTHWTHTDSGLLE